MWTDRITSLKREDEVRDGTRLDRRISVSTNLDETAVNGPVKSLKERPTADVGTWRSYGLVLGKEGGVVGGDFVVTP